MKNWGKRHKGCLLLLVFFGILLLVGVGYRQTITEYTKKDYCEQYFQPAEIPENFAISSAEEMKETLPESEIILKVRATGEKQYLYSIFQQGAEVETVYKGSEELENQHIWLARYSWQVYFEGDQRYADTGFVNYMQEGKEYLVFLDGKMDASVVKTAYPVYDVAENCLITPIFCLEDGENVVVAPGEDNSYVDYSLVSNNEFFACTQAGMDALEELKEYFLSRYVYA